MSCHWGQGVSSWGCRANYVVFERRACRASVSLRSALRGAKGVGVVIPRLVVFIIKGPGIFFGLFNLNRAASEPKRNAKFDCLRQWNSGKWFQNLMNAYSYFALDYSHYQHGAEVPLPGYLVPV